MATATLSEVPLAELGGPTSSNMDGAKQELSQLNSLFAQTQGLADQLGIDKKAFPNYSGAPAEQWAWWTIFYPKFQSNIETRLKEKTGTVYDDPIDQESREMGWAFQKLSSLSSKLAKATPSANALATAIAAVDTNIDNTRKSIAAIAARNGAKAPGPRLKEVMEVFEGYAAAWTSTKKSGEMKTVEQVPLQTIQESLSGFLKDAENAWTKDNAPTQEVKGAQAQAAAAKSQAAAAQSQAAAAQSQAAAAAAEAKKKAEEAAAATAAAKAAQDTSSRVMIVLGGVAAAGLAYFLTKGKK